MRRCTPTTLLYSGVTEQILTKFLHHVARSSQMNVLKSEVRYFNPLNRPISPISTLKLIAEATSLERSGKCQIGNLWSNAYCVVNIWWKSVQ